MIKKLSILFLLVCIATSSATLEQASDITLYSGSINAYYNTPDSFAKFLQDGQASYVFSSTLNKNESIFGMEVTGNGSNGRFAVGLLPTDAGISHKLNINDVTKIKSDVYVESVREVDIEEGTDFRRVLTEYSVLADAGTGLMTVQRSEDGKMQDQERVYFDGIININSTVFEDCFELPGEGEEDWLPCLGMPDYPDWTVEISDDSSCATCG